MQRAEEEAALAADHKRVRMAEQPPPDYLADMLVALRTAANGFVRQCTSTNIAHQLGVTPFSIEALEAKLVSEQLTKEGAESCVVSCYDHTVPVLDRVMRLYATVKMMNKEVLRKAHGPAAHSAEASPSGGDGAADGASALADDGSQGRQRAGAANARAKYRALRPRWLIINDENFQVVCSFDPSDLPALQQANFASSTIAHKQKLATSVQLPSSSPMEFEILPFQQVTYLLDLERAPEAGWLRVAELLNVASVHWMAEAESRYLTGKGDSSPHTDTEIEVAEV